jgi:hypothetical protein
LATLATIHPLVPHPYQPQQSYPKMPDDDCVRIREQLSLHPGSILGFIIYRLTYSDDAQWARFIDHLNTRTRLGLEAYGEGDLFAHIDWSVQSDPKLQDADHDQVRA